MDVEGQSLPDVLHSSKRNSLFTESLLAIYLAGILYGLYYCQLEHPWKNHNIQQNGFDLTLHTSMANSKVYNIVTALYEDNPRGLQKF